MFICELTTALLNPHFNTLPTLINYLKSSFNSRNKIKVFTEIKIKHCVEKNGFD